MFKRLIRSYLDMPPQPPAPRSGGLESTLPEEGRQALLPGPDKTLVLLEEYKQLWDDLLQTRAELRRTFVYVNSFAVVFVGIARLAPVSTSTLTATYSFLFASMIFSLIGLNYVALMRHHQFVMRYLESIGNYVRRQVGVRSGVKGEQYAYMNWTDFMKSRYRPRYSKLIFFVTWGSQPMIPTIFSPAAFIYAVSSGSLGIVGLAGIVNYPIVNLMVVLAILQYSFFVAGLWIAIGELFEYVRLSPEEVQADFEALNDVGTPGR
jgi:hypothetical protein